MKQITKFKRLLSGVLSAVMRASEKKSVKNQPPVIK